MQSIKWQPLGHSVFHAAGITQSDTTAPGIPRGAMGRGKYAQTLWYRGSAKHHTSTTIPMLHWKYRKSMFNSFYGSQYLQVFPYLHVIFLISLVGWSPVCNKISSMSRPVIWHFDICSCSIWLDIVLFFSVKMFLETFQQFLIAQILLPTFFFHFFFLNLILFDLFPWIVCKIFFLHSYCPFNRPCVARVFLHTVFLQFTPDLPKTSSNRCHA